MYKFHIEEKNEQKCQHSNIHIVEGSSVKLTLGKRLFKYNSYYYVIVMRFVSCKNMNAGEKSCCKHHSGPNHVNRLTFASSYINIFTQHFCWGDASDWLLIYNWLTVKFRIPMLVCPLCSLRSKWLIVRLFWVEFSRV